MMSRRFHSLPLKEIVCMTRVVDISFFAKQSGDTVCIVKGEEITNVVEHEDMVTFDTKEGSFSCEQREWFLL